MTKCVYCIGCIHYRPEEAVWCSHPDRDNCEGRKYWTGTNEEDEDDDECML